MIEEVQYVSMANSSVSQQPANINISDISTVSL